MPELAHFLGVHRALADTSRVRALALLVRGELCLCELIQVLGLAPSTVSKHMTELLRAGLVERRKQGRWHFYRLPGKSAPARVREAVARVRRLLPDDPQLRADVGRLAEVKRMKPGRVSACYQGRR
jgi:DNA-binding transcriptional ArsR family regulator